MTNTASAKGIPDRAYYGEPDKIEPGTELDLVQQLHLALRAGRHFDYRFGDKKRGLYSWVTRKGIPGPGGRVAMFQQPAHSYAYKDFEGTIPAPGYGAGTVKKQDEGKILVTKTSPGFIHFTRTDKKYPERFVLFKPKTKPGRKDDWLLANVTPTKALPYSKLRYTRVAAEDVESKLKDMKEGDTVSAKVDGASALIQLLRNKAEVTSYRAASGTGFPILHTEKVFHGKNQIELPPELEGTVLKGELFGTKGKKVIPPQELGGLLNATVANSLQMQRDKHVKLRSLLYDIQQYGKTPVDLQTTPRAERYALLQKVIKHLPKDKFQLSDDVPAEKALELWKQIGSGQHPLTEEGIVGWPAKGKPWKAKYTEDADVNITNVFPGEGKYEGVGAGGFEYSTDKAVTGRVGTGFSDEVRKDMLANPDKYIGRVARIRSQQQLPSGVYRAPSFIALHEDYPAAGQSADLVRSNRGEVEKEAAVSYSNVNSAKQNKAIKTAAEYRLTGDVQGVGLRKQLHQLLDEYNLPGLAYNNARTGEVRAFIGGRKSRRELVLTALHKYLAENSDDYQFEEVPVEEVPARTKHEPVKLNLSSLDKAYHRHGFTSVPSWDVDKRRQWAIDRFRLKQDGDLLVGKLPTLAYRQVLGLEPVYRQQLTDPGDFGPQFWQNPIDFTEHSYYIADSDIHGKGTFAGKDYKTGDTVGRALILKADNGLGYKTYTRTELGKFVNYQPKGNVGLSENENGDLYLEALEDILKDAEMYTQPYDGELESWIPYEIVENEEDEEKQAEDNYHWRGVDLDGTLANYEEFEGPTVIGKPVPKMVRRIKRWLANGENVKILTARVSGPDAAAARRAIEAWCEKHIGEKLPVTCKKDHAMTELWDDRAVQVVQNTGDRADKTAEFTDPSYDPAHPDECCPSCGARLERGDDGDCNRCGKPWPIKEAEFDFSYEKQSFDTALHWQALKSVPFKYETGQGLLQNALGHLKRVRDAGLNRIDQQRNYNSYRDSLVGPDAKWDRLIKSVQGHPNPEGFSDVDRLIQRYTQLGL